MAFPRIALLSVAAIALAQQHPNFTGTWILNRAESDFTDKRAVAPDSLTLTVHHKATISATIPFVKRTIIRAGAIWIYRSAIPIRSEAKAPHRPIGKATNWSSSC
jgi:hypothetical protein